eukprot:1909963-Rhodomonas_salina.2
MSGTEIGGGGVSFEGVSAESERVRAELLALKELGDCRTETGGGRREGLLRARRGPCPELRYAPSGIVLRARYAFCGAEIGRGANRSAGKGTDRSLR